MLKPQQNLWGMISDTFSVILVLFFFFLGEAFICLFCFLLRWEREANCDCPRKDCKHMDLQTAEFRSIALGIIKAPPIKCDFCSQPVHPISELILHLLLGMVQVRCRGITLSTIMVSLASTIICIIIYHLQTNHTNHALKKKNLKITTQNSHLFCRQRNATLF